MLKGMRALVGAALLLLLAMPALAVTKEEAIAAFLALQARVEALESQPTTQQLKVFDRNDAPVGSVQTAGSGIANIFFEIDDRIIFSQVDQANIAGGDLVFYLSTNCTGSAFIRPFSEAKLVSHFYGFAPPPSGDTEFDLLTLYVPDLTAIPTEIEVGSSYGAEIGSEAPGFCSTPIPGPEFADVLPALPIELPFAPPFRLEIE